jgi:hypothetical protein
VDTNEIGAQLLNCLDRALQLFVHRDLGGSADNATQADMLRVIELLVVEEVETDMYENLDVRNDALYTTKVEVFLNEKGKVEEVGKDMRLVRGPSTKVQLSDDHSFDVDTDRDIAKQYATLHSEEKHSKPVTKRSAKRAAKRARQRSAKYETTAAMVLVDEEQAVMVVPKVVGKDMLHMSDGGQEGGAKKEIPKSDPYHKQGGQHHLLEPSGNGGGLGGANEQEIPKNIVRLEENLEETLKETLEETLQETLRETLVKCEEPYCQFSVEIEDMVYAPRVLRNHMFVAHKRQGQIIQQEMSGRKRGRRKVTSNQELEKTSENNKLIKRLNMSTLGHRIWPEKSSILKSSLPEVAVQDQVLAAEDTEEVQAAEDPTTPVQVLAAEDSPKYTPVDEAVNVQVLAAENSD